MLKASFLIAFGLLCAGAALAEEGEIPLLDAGTDIKSIESLQRGARNFMNDCSGCHSPLQPSGNGSENSGGRPGQ
jgi:ubiquinol-cytochrome c reductase cytochrome c1 subunit